MFELIKQFETGMQENQSIIIFDGVCNLCNSTVGFLQKRDRKKQFKFISLQSDEGSLLIQKYKIPSEIDSIIFIKSNRVYFESDVITEIARMLHFPWRLGAWAGIIPKKTRDKLYRVVAKNRYRWFGKPESCKI